MGHGTCMKFVRKNKRLMLWTTLPVLFGVLVSSFLFSFLKIGNALESTKSVLFAGSMAPKETENEKPKYFYINKSEGAEPKVSAQAFLVGDLKTGEVILSKNQERKFPIASVSKLMTALVASEIAKEDDIAQVSKKALATKGTNGNFTTGQKIKVNDLLYPLLLESSNDAAEIIAEHFERNVFIQKMNQQAEILKM